MNDRATRVRVCGPLAPYADGFRAVLAERGYAPSSAAGQLQMMAHLSRWLFDHGLDGHGLTPVVVAEFLQARRAAGYKQRLSARGMAPLLGYLREGGIAAVRAPAVANSPVEVLLAGYRTYLVEERGLAASTVRNYLDVARPFVSARCASGRADLSGLTAAEVSEFVLVGCRTRAVGSATAKFNKPRQLPLHATTVVALVAYAACRDRLCPRPRTAALFVSTSGARLSATTVSQTFRDLLRRSGVEQRSPARRPCIHDARHTFAVSTLLGWYRDGVDVQARLPLLSTYLGHTDPRHTYWYLSAAPKLLELAANRIPQFAEVMS